MAEASPLATERRGDDAAAWSTPEAKADVDSLHEIMSSLEGRLAESEGETAARLGVKSAAEVVDDARVQDSRITELLETSLGRRGSRPWSASASSQRRLPARPQSGRTPPSARPASAPGRAAARPASAPPLRLASAGRPVSAAPSAASSAGASSGTPLDVVTIEAAKAGRWTEVDDAIADGTHPAGPWLLEACEAEAANIDEAEAIVAFARRLLGASPDAGGTVAWQNERGHAALHVLSCRAGSANPSVGLLLASLAGVVIGHGADVSATDVNGYAPLHLLALAASQVRPRTAPASAFRC